MKINAFGREQEPAWEISLILQLNSYPPFMMNVWIPKVSKHIIGYDFLAGKTFMMMGANTLLGFVLPLWEKLLWILLF